MLIDTHCHFDAPPFITELAASVKRFENAGVANIIVPAVSSQNFKIVLQLTERFPSIYCALGLHPIYTHKQQDIELLAAQLNQHYDKVVAIGEIGLDGYIEHINIEEQKLFLTAQLDLAKQYHLPVILHARRANSLLYKELKNARLPEVGVIHGFSGSYEEAIQFIRLGFYIGVGGVISYPRANKTRQAISRIPLSSILLETDAPDMPLNGLQGQANRPENIVKVFAELSKLRIEPSSQILNTTLMNTLTLFSRINTMKVG
ncbi:TatD family hydrolase [Orbus sturtevantii]|uniref:TatD family hydrolase n=1 Tax=Orbus sturtevantii TaxID=3074109 RepID=UPI00370D6C94